MEHISERISASEKRQLKAKAHHLKPVIQIGRKGITKTLMKAIDDALFIHELIKIQFLDYKEEKKDIAQEIAKDTESAIVDMIGNILILYKENPEKE
jgi:RNA-binding protein